MKHRCPYCGRYIKESAKACASHRDLIALDRKWTGWTPRAPVESSD